MSTLYLHIGIPKTGTTSLQNFLASNEDVLKQHGICYPDFHFDYPGIGIHRNAHFLITTGYLDEEGNRILEKEKEDFERGFRMLEDCAEKYPKIILSDEGIWFPAVTTRSNFWEEMKNQLDASGLDIKIIVYFRRQDLFVQSHWAQKVKEGADIDFHEYLESPFFTEYPLDYYRYMNYLASLFGKEALIIRVFEKGQFEGEENTIQSDFLNIFGLKMTDGFVVEKEVYNTSLQGDYLEMKRVLNALPEFHSNRHMLIANMKKIQDMQLFEHNYKKTTYFGPGEQEHFMEAFNEGNAKLAREYLGRDNGVLFFDDVKDLPEYSVKDGDLLRDVMLVYGTVIDILNEKEKESQEKIKSLQEEVKVLKKETREKDKEIQKMVKDLREDVIYYRLKRKIRHLSGKDE